MEKLKMKLINYALRKLFPIFEVENVLTVSKSGHLFLNGEVVQEKQKNSLKAQARMLRDSGLWEIMAASLKHRAQKIAFDESQTLQDLLNAKMILYTISVQENMIKNIENVH
jgi:hypothetical protein